MSYYVMFFSVFECGNRVVSENIFYFCPILDTTVLHAINPALLLRRQSCVILQFDLKVNKQIRNNNYLVDNNQIGTTIINYCQIISSNWNHYLNSIIWPDYDEPKMRQETNRIEPDEVRGMTADSNTQSQNLIHGEKRRLPTR